MRKFRDRLFTAALLFKEGAMLEAELWDVIDTLIAEVEQSARADRRKADRRKQQWPRAPRPIR